MEIQINPNEVQEVLNYINKINEYDRRNFVRLQSINSLIWGILFIYAGVSDYLFSSIGQSSFSGISWAIASISGMLISIYINKRKPTDIMTKEIALVSERMRNIYYLTLSVTIISWLLMILFIFIFGLYFLIIPIVGFLIGSTFIVINIKYGSRIRFREMLNPTCQTQFIPFVSYLTTIINVFGYLVNPNFIDFMGLILGVMVGAAFILGGLLDHNN